MSQIADIISARLAELEPQVAELERKLDPLRAELADLKKAAAALRGPRIHSRAPGEEPGADTIQGQALAVVRMSDRPLTAEEIISGIDDKFGRAVARASIAPQLSRLRQDGFLEHRGKRYAIAAAIEALPLSARAALARDQGEGSDDA